MTDRVSLNVNGLVLKSAQDVDSAFKAGKITKEQANSFKAMFAVAAPDLEKGTAVQTNPDAKELTEDQKAKKDQARQAELDEVAAAKKQVQEKGLETEHGVITSYTGTFKDERTGEEKKVNVFTFDIKAPEAEQQKIKKENEQARMARYYDEDAGEWIELGEKYQTMKDVRAALKTKKETIDDELDALKKKIKASKKDSNVPLKQIKEDNARLAYLQQEYAQVKIAYKASKGRGMRGTTRAYNANVKANNRLVNREVYYDKAAAKAAEKDPANEGKTIKFATDDDKAVLRALSATAMQHFEESSSPQEKAMWNELAHLFTDEKGNEIPIEKVDTKKIQDALIDLTGGDMRLNYTEQQMVATETGLSMSDVRHAVRTYGFEAPHPIGKRIVNGLLAAAPVAASMGLGYLLSKNKSHAEAHSEQTTVDHAVSDASQTTIVNGEVTASTPGAKIDWVASNGDEFHRSFAGQSVTEYYEAVATANAHAEAHAKAFATADAACTAVAALKPAALAAAPLVAFLAGFAKRPAEISAVKGAATTQKMATYADVYKKNGSYIGNQIVQMAGQITGDKAIDRALIVSVLDHDIGSQNTTPTPRELRNALAHLDAIKAEVDKFKKLPPPPEPTPAPTSAPTPEPTVCATVYTHTWYDEDTHCQPIKLRVVNGMSPVYPSAVRYGYNGPDGKPVTDTKTLNKIQAELKRLRGERAGIQTMPGHASTISVPLTLTIDGKTYTFDCENGKARIENSPNGIPRKGNGKDISYYKIGDSYYKQDCNDPVPVQITKEEWNAHKQ